MKSLLFWILALPVVAADTAADAADSPTAKQPMRAPRLSPPDVKRGDKVAVTVVSGPVQLKFEAETESAGHVGETVIVKNPENGRRFVAKVEAVGKVVVKK